MTWNEIALVVFLFVLITSWGVLPSIGAWIATLMDRKDPGSSR